MVCEFWANLANGGKGMRIRRIERILRKFFKLGCGLRIFGEWERIIKKGKFAQFVKFAKFAKFAFPSHLPPNSLNS